MAYGSPSAIQTEIKKRIITFGKNGGLVLAAAYDLEPKVKWEDVLALVKAVRKEA